MKWFNENMSHSEARKLFFRVMSKEPTEAEKIEAEYEKVLAVIIPRELKENELCLTSESL